MRPLSRCLDSPTLARSHGISAHVGGSAGLPPISDVPVANLHPDPRVAARQDGRAGTRRRCQALRRDRQRERAAGAGVAGRGGARMARARLGDTARWPWHVGTAGLARPDHHLPVPSSPALCPRAPQSDRIKKLLDPSPSATAGLKEKIQGMKHLIAVSGLQNSCASKAAVFALLATVEPGALASAAGRQQPVAPALLRNCAAAASSCCLREHPACAGLTAACF